jgi:ComF family protein
MIKRIINLLLPPKCSGCSNKVSGYNYLCSECWKNLNFINDPKCKTCGTPFEFELNEESPSNCLLCIKKPPKYNKSRSLLKFDDVSKKIIHKFKYYDKTIISKFFANQFYLKYKDIIENCDVITCVPMHKLKRIFRLYNHSQILAKDLSLISNKKFIANLLLKIKYTKSQTFLNKNMRKINLKDSISFNDKFEINGKKILILDDVITTGVTINLCCKILLENGAKSVDVISIAKNYK